MITIPYTSFTGVYGIFIFIGKQVDNKKCRKDDNMLFLDEIPHLKLYKIKTYLPTDRQKRTHGSCILLNTSSIQSDIELMTHKMFENSKFNGFYMDFMYTGKVHTRVYRENRKKERVEEYTKLRDGIKSRSISTYATQQAIAKRNVYYDLHHENNIFFEKAGDLHYKRKVKCYLDLLKTFFEKDLVKSYQMKTMFINVKEWD